MDVDEISFCWMGRDDQPFPQAGTRASISNACHWNRDVRDPWTRRGKKPPIEGLGGIFLFGRLGIIGGIGGWFVFQQVRQLDAEVLT